MAAHTNAGGDRIGIAGAGPVAQAFGRALQQRGVRIACVASRHLSHAAAAAELIGEQTIAVPYSEVASYSEHVLVAVSDRAITTVAEELAKGSGKFRAALHTCGSYGPEVLSPLSARGVSCGSIHPLQTIRDGSQGAAVLHGSAFAVCGDSDALCWAEQLAVVLSGYVLRIRPEFRQLYHAAAVMASNYVAALLDAAEHLMLLAGVCRKDALRALGPLARTSLDNIFTCGPAGALTGPVLRGDAQTVIEHTRELEGAGDSIADLYKAAGVHALRMARQRGLGAEEAERVQQALLGRR
jgi:predicted short-subunit dehydrogenase-like oxidoreductase (DUF2520 family)